MVKKRLIWKDEFGGTHSTDEKINGKFVGDKDIREKLYEYEQEESEGRLIHLPCKVGDVVYSYCKDLFRILPYFIEEIIINYDSDSPNNEYVTFIGISSNASELLDDIDFTIDEIGKTVFLSKEEAEQALKKENKRNE